MSDLEIRRLIAAALQDRIPWPILADALEDRDGGFDAEVLARLRNPVPEYWSYPWEYDWAEVFLLPELRGSNWREAFGYAGEPYTEGRPNVEPVLGQQSKVPTTPFSRFDVEELLALSAGEHDEQSWMIAGRLFDGRWFFLEAGCCYTGWDSSAGGQATVASTRECLFYLGLTDEARERLGLPLEKI